MRRLPWLILLAALATSAQAQSPHAQSHSADKANSVDWQARVDAAMSAAEQADAAAWRARSERAIQAAEQAPAPGAYQWNNLPTPASPTPDILPLVERFQGYMERQAQGQPVPGGLSVFVSLAMPRASLNVLVAEAERTGATLVLRGMVDRSLTQTMLAVQTLIGGRQVAWTIDPEAFARFQVEAVPVFVLTRHGARPSGCGDDRCFAQDDFVRLAGDVSISYALDAIDRLAPQFSDDVAYARAGR